jgi:hypothetical protein
MIALLFALAVGATPPERGLFEPPIRRLLSREEARRAMIQCGLPSDSVAVRYEPDLQEDVVWVALRKGSLVVRQLRCIASASLKTAYDVSFPDPAVQKRYDALFFQMENAADTARSRDWLRERRLLAKLPLPRKGKPLSNYTEAVEAFCGIKRGTFLVARDEHTVTFTKDGLGKITPRAIEHAATSEAQFECVMAATSAADLMSRGIFFGIAGNAAAGKR